MRWLLAQGAQAALPAQPTQGAPPTPAHHLPLVAPGLLGLADCHPLPPGSAFILPLPGLNCVYRKNGKVPSWLHTHSLLFLSPPLQLA